MEKKFKFDARSLKALKPEAKLYDIIDTNRDSPRAFGARVMPTGEISFHLYRRYPGSLFPVRRVLGRFDGTFPSIDAARKKARAWLTEIEAGRDPLREKKRLEAERIQIERSRRANSVEKALGDYIASKAHLRTVRALEAEFRRELKPWLDAGKSLADIADPDAVEDLINAIKVRPSKRSDRSCSGQARVFYDSLNGFFNWVIKNRKFGITSNPCAMIDKETLVGQKQKRERVLDNHELRAYWAAAEKLSYPVGSFFQMLLLTGLRRSEVANARWSEFEEGRWIIPSSRMKARPGKAQAHLVPIVPRIASLLKSLPRRGPFVFSNASDGSTAISSFVYFKQQLDELMRAELAKEIEPFTIHDIRRTARTRFGELGIPEHIGERLLAHAQPEMQQRYNLHGYEKEKALALETWHTWLMDLVNPRPDLRIVA